MKNLLIAGCVALFLSGCASSHYRTRYIDPDKFPPWPTLSVTIEPYGQTFRVADISTKRLSVPRGGERLWVQLYSKDQIIVQPDFIEFYTTTAQDCGSSGGGAYTLCNSRFAMRYGQSQFVPLGGHLIFGPGRYAMVDYHVVQKLSSQARVWEAVQNYAQSKGLTPPNN